MDYLKDLNSFQKAAVTHTEGPCLVIAGAGSGKTRVLTYRIAHLIKEHKIAKDMLTIHLIIFNLFFISLFLLFLYKFYPIHFD